MLKSEYPPLNCKCYTRADIYQVLRYDTDMTTKEIFDSKYEINSNGDVYSNIRNKPMKIQNRNNYSSVVCSGTRHNIHRLVAQAFIPNPKNLGTVNHINGNKKDNRVENLEWCTLKENIRHAWKAGLATSKVGENKHTSVLDDMHILTLATMHSLYDREKLALYLPNREGRKVFVKPKKEQVRRIVKGERWAHLNHLF